MKKLFLLVVSVFVIFNSAIALTYNSDPKIFVTELVNDAIKVLSDKSITQEKKVETIEKIALANVDIKALGMYALGQKRKTINKDDLEKYNNLFEKYFLKSLTSRLTDYSSSKFETLGEDKKSPNYTIVNVNTWDENEK